VATPHSLPEQFGRYRILRPLGQGGMGSVYLAHDTQLDRPVALKVPHFQPEDGPQVRERFFREARAAATLAHPNLCPVHDVGEINGTPYLTMAYIEGQPLSHLLRDGQPWPQRLAAKVVRKLALALQEAHARGVIHRDLKPANIMINARKEPVIMDFGLAHRAGPDNPRLTQTGQILGTPAYMSPEQSQGNQPVVGPNSDIYSLGVILYELLTGRLPFEGPAPLILGLRAVHEPEPPSKHRADLDPRLEAICLKAMAKKVEDRYVSAAELAAALTNYLRQESPASQPPPPQHTAASPGLREDDPPPTGENRPSTIFAAPFASQRPSSSVLRHARPAGQRRRLLTRSRLLVASALLGLSVLCGILLYVSTDHGTIKIQVDGADATAEVQVDGQAITAGGLGEPLRLRAGKHGLVVTTKDGELVRQAFTVRRGGHDVLRVALTPVKIKEKPVTKSAQFRKNPEQYLTGTRWQFYCPEDKFICQVILERGGIIGNSVHPQEARWKVIGERIVFSRDDGFETSWFSLFGEEGNRLEFRGPFVANGWTVKLREVVE
jgi:serine/threonine protein kinase